MSQDFDFLPTMSNEALVDYFREACRQARGSLRGLPYEAVVATKAELLRRLNGAK